MSSEPVIDPSVRQQLIDTPEALLEDKEIMRALVAANERAMGNNIVDLRGIAMERLESRLDRLEDAHRSVIAAAYENLAGTNQIHRAILRIMEAPRFDAFLRDLAGDVSDILRVHAMRLVLETAVEADEPAVRRMNEVLSFVEPGFVNEYLTRGRQVPARSVTLRQVQPDEGSIYREKSSHIRSEACLRLDLGMDRLPGLLILGSEDPHQFTQQQGTDLLTFFAGVFERLLRRWLD